MEIEVPGAWPYLGGAILIVGCIIAPLAVRGLLRRAVQSVGIPGTRQGG